MLFFSIFLHVNPYYGPRTQSLQIFCYLHPLFSAKRSSRALLAINHLDMQKQLFSVMLIFALSAQVHGQHSVLSVDSLFLNGIAGFYEQAEHATGHIWPGMELSPVCLYRVNGPAILYNHPNPPESFEKIADRTYLGTQAELQLMGSTITEINDVPVAIALPL